MVPSFLSLKQTATAIIDSGREKLAKRARLLMLQAIVASVCVGFGAIGYLKIAAHTADKGLGMFLGAAVFPAGIVAITFFCAELFTSNCSLVLGVYLRQYNFWKIFRVLGIVWAGNLVGAIFLGTLTYFSGIFDASIIQFVMNLAQGKTAMPVVQLLASGALCNIIVCAAVWLATAVKSAGAKIAVLWLLIVIFVLSGSEHIVANMYFLLSALFFGANITVSGICYNLLLVTLGNLIGGAVLFAGIQALIVSRQAEDAEQA